VIDAAVRADALLLQLLVVVGQRLGIEGEGDMVEADFAAGARGLAFGFDGDELRGRLRVEVPIPRKSVGKTRNANDNAYALAA